MSNRQKSFWHALLGVIEIPWLMVLNVWNHFWNFGIWTLEIRRYYRNPFLMKADWLWMLEYGLKSPFTLSRQATEQAGLPDDLTVYGETPWTTLEKVCEAVKLGTDDVFVELGAGTGRNLLFVHYWYGARAVGYELVPRFVEKFSWLQKHLLLEGVADLHLANWFDENLAGSVFFLVGSCYSDEHLEQATAKLLELEVESRVVTVSYPLTDPGFELLESFSAPFSWGIGTVYVHKRCV